jgi:fatty acid desaturase
VPPPRGNLGPRERCKRLVFGAAMLVVALAVTGGLLAGGVSRWWRLILFVPFALAAHGVFQAREST